MCVNRTPKIVMCTTLEGWSGATINLQHRRRRHHLKEPGAAHRHAPRAEESRGSTNHPHHPETVRPGPTGSTRTTRPCGRRPRSETARPSKSSPAATDRPCTGMGTACSPKKPTSPTSCRKPSWPLGGSSDRSEQTPPCKPGCSRSAPTRSPTSTARCGPSPSTNVYSKQTPTPPRMSRSPGRRTASSSLPSTRLWRNFPSASVPPGFYEK